MCSSVCGAFRQDATESNGEDTRQTAITPFSAYPFTQSLEFSSRWWCTVMSSVSSMSPFNECYLKNGTETGNDGNIDPF